MTSVYRKGINPELLGHMVEGIREHPEAGSITVRMRHRWDDGFAVDGHCEKNEVGGEVLTRTHTFRTDWPEPFGRDSGPTPGTESLLAAIGACVATTYMVTAARQGVAVDELEVTTEGRLDLQGLFELAPIRSGFSGVTIHVRVRSSAADDALEDLGRSVTRTSPVYESMAHPVPMQLSVHRLP